MEIQDPYDIFHPFLWRKLPLIASNQHAKTCSVFVLHRVSVHCSAIFESVLFIYAWLDFNALHIKRVTLETRTINYSITFTSDFFWRLTNTVYCERTRATILVSEAGITYWLLFLEGHWQQDTNTRKRVQSGNCSGPDRRYGQLGLNLCSRDCWHLLGWNETDFGIIAREIWEGSA